MAALFGMLASPAQAQILPDGTTATTVNTAANGKATVNIALPVAGVSHNTYSRFDVTAAGADFINGVNARTIVNEVTSSNPSLIEGPIAVVGPRANFILANPNGITVNDGSFINTGHVALSTGKVSFDDFNIAPGLMQRNVLLDTSRGQIEIGRDGLSGALIDLELIAKRVSIDGPVTNTFTSSSAMVRVTAGASHAEFNTGLSPVDNLNPWVGFSTPGASDPGATLVDITPFGSLTAGRIELMVTDHGAGVRDAGKVFANAGDFTLLASGQLKIDGGTVQAARDIVIRSGTVDADDVTDSNAVHGLRKTLIQADAGNIDVAADAGVKITGSDVVAAGSVAIHSGEFVLANDGTAGSTLVAAGGGVLIDSGSDITSTGSLIQGERRIDDVPASRGAVTLDAAGSIVNQSPSQDVLGAIFGRHGDVVLAAGGDVTNRSGRILSNAQLDIAAGGDVSNEIEHVPGADDGRRVDFHDDGKRWLILTERTSGFDIDYGTVPASGQLAYLVSDTGTRISGRNVTNRGGGIFSNNGNVQIDAQRIFDNEVVLSGSVHFERSCLIFCSTDASSTVQSHGGLISAGRDVMINAGTRALNVGGFVTALGEIDIATPEAIARGVPGYSIITRARGLKAWFGDTWAQIYAADQGGVFTAGGRIRIAGTAIVDGGAFDGNSGLTAGGGVTTIRRPQRDPVLLADHVGATSWLWK
ncbi:MAG TPA: filamentous hemagglutinin N-terminal domain-containing protein [Burkholderiales bacterium]|nr:filamentous hemagglutinin N-terminal domain-containing protein [Burkholderiales bacterium]